MSFRTKWGISVLRFFELRPQNDNMAVICVHLCPIRFCSCIFFSTPSHIICPIVIWASPFSPNASICNSLSFLPSRLNLWFKISASLIISHLPQDFKTFCVLILFNYGKDVSYSQQVYQKFYNSPLIYPYRLSHLHFFHHQKLPSKVKNMSKKCQNNDWQPF